MRTVELCLVALLSVATGLTAAACGGDGRPEAVPDEAQEGETAGVRWVILPPGGSTEFYEAWRPYERSKPADVRAALSGVVAALETERRREDLPAFIDKRIWREMLTGVLDRMPAYRCQAVTATSEEGTRFVYLNFFAESSFQGGEDYEPSMTDEEWRTEAVMVDDGGDHYWQVKFDPKTGAFFDIEINGEA